MNINNLLEPVGKFLSESRQQMLLPRQEILDICGKVYVKYSKRKKPGWSLAEMKDLIDHLYCEGVLNRTYSLATLWRIEHGFGCSLESLLTYAWMLGKEKEIFLRQ